MSTLPNSSATRSVFDTVPVEDHVFTEAGLRVCATSPGALAFNFDFGAHLIDLNLAPAMTRLAINSDRLVESVTPENSIACVPAGTTGRIATENRDWCLSIEIKPDRLESLTHDDRLTPDRSFREYRTFDTAPRAAHLGRLLLGHLRFGEPDRLLVEGLSLAILADGLNLARGHRTPVMSSADTDPRIARAIDYIEAHLGKDLSVAEIATIAAMSPSWFQSVFRAIIGRPVFAYVRERRFERARVLLADRRLSLSQIAYTCGFSSHSHMSRMFRARYGTSPSDMR